MLRFLKVTVNQKPETRKLVISIALGLIAHDLKSDLTLSTLVLKMPKFCILVNTFFKNWGTKVVDAT